MGWGDIGVDPADIPDRFQVNWKFLNGFFEAFQERADYIEGAARAESYDSLLFTNSQVSASEFHSRLSIFNANILSCFTSTIWYKSSTWNQLSGFSSQATDLNSRDFGVPGLTVIDLEPWEEVDLRSLLTDEVYEDIFGNGTGNKFVKPSYWSGLYKLLTEVMLYRDLTVTTAYNPNETEPILVLNGLETASDAGEDLSSVVQNLNSSNKFNHGSKKLKSGGIGASTSYRKLPNGTEETTESAGGNYEGLTKNPFCKVPGLMEIEILLWRDGGRRFSSFEQEGIQGEENGTELIEFQEPVASSFSQEKVDGSFEDPVWTPDEDSVGKKIAQNKHLGVSYNASEGTASVSLSSLVDIRSSHNVEQTPSPEGEPSGFKPFVSNINQTDEATYILNIAMCALPQSSFEFPA